MYTTKTDVENYLLTDIDSAFDSQITNWISSAQAWIDRQTDRTFEATAGLKKFNGNGKGKLPVEDLLSVSTLWFTANDATGDANTDTLATTDFYLYQDDSSNHTPFNRIVLNPSRNYGHFPEGMQNVWIQGSWGFSATVPADIQMVATKLVASIVRTGKDDGVSSYTQGDLSVTYREFQRLLNSDISLKEVLESYKRPIQMGGCATIRV